MGILRVENNELAFFSAKQSDTTRSSFIGSLLETAMPMNHRFWPFLVESNVSPKFVLSDKSDSATIS